MFGDVLVCLLIVILILSYAKFRRSKAKFYEFSNQIPGMSELPLIGHLHHAMDGDIMKILMRCDKFCYENTRLTKLWLGPELYLFVCDPEYAKIILNTFFEKDMTYKFLRMTTGSSLLAATPVSVWKSHRKVLAPSFGSRLMKGFMDVFKENHGKLLSMLSEFPLNEPFDIYSLTKRCNFDIICEIALGIKLNSLCDEDNLYARSVASEMHIIYERMFKIWFWDDRLFKLSQGYRKHLKNLEILQKLMNEIITNKRNELQLRYESNGGNSNELENQGFKSFVEMMLEVNPMDKFNDAEIKDEIMGLLFGGSETTSSIMYFLLVILGSLPRIQDKVVHELRSIFGDSKRPVEKDDCTQMHYLNRVIKETLRIFPVGAVIGRKLTSEIKLGDYTVPTGVGCIISINGLHKDKTAWGENVDDFDPDRFLPENSKNRHSHSFLAFSSGPRNCLGEHFALLSIKTYISLILRDYIIKSSKHYKDVEVKTELSLIPVDRNIISFERRSIN